MKYTIRIFIDGYETTVKKLKKHEIKAISDSITEYINQKRFSFTIEMSRYNEPLAMNVPSDFKTFTGKHISLNPFGFHEPLDIQFDYIDEFDAVHYCDDIWCDGHCGALYCGCIDVCRGRCGHGYDSY
jgi:hypothetical protein